QTSFSRETPGYWTELGIHLGGWGDRTHYFVGKTRDVIVASKALTSDEIKGIAGIRCLPIEYCGSADSEECNVFIENGWTVQGNFGNNERFGVSGMTSTSDILSNEAWSTNLMPDWIGSVASNAQYSQTCANGLPCKNGYYVTPDGMQFYRGGLLKGRLTTTLPSEHNEYIVVFGALAHEYGWNHCSCKLSVGDDVVCTTPHLAETDSISRSSSKEGDGYWISVHGTYEGDTVLEIEENGVCWISYVLVRTQPNTIQINEPATGCPMDEESIIFRDNWERSHPRHGQTEVLEMSSNLGIIGNAPRTLGGWINIRIEDLNSHPSGMIPFSLGPNGCYGMTGRYNADCVICNQLFALTILQNSRWGVYGMCGANDIHFNVNVDVADNRWHHVAVTYNGTHIEAFIDGMFQTTHRGPQGEDSTHLYQTELGIQSGGWGGQ
ncbi:unnamed protein product, partial [marine sediment metagenome]